MTLSAGTRLGPYEILAPIGAGGMGEVYKARDTRLERTVAVKVLAAHLSTSEETRQRFEREAKTISQFSHPHICALHDVGREGDTDYLVMEFLEGESLADRLGKGALPTEQILRYGIEIADALDKAHRQGIVHRDLKPGNVMITKTGVKLLDFGLAKPLIAAGARPVSGASVLATEAQVSQPLTERGTVLGTFQYMAPEQLEGGEADGRSDIFAFGAVLYEMATGRKAFIGKSQASLIGSILKDDPPSVTEASPMIPPALNRVVKTCLAKDPEDRFQTAHDVKLQLQWIAEGGSQVGLPAPVAARRKSREKLAWAIAAAAILAAGLATFGYLRRAPKPPRIVRFDIATPEEIVSLDAPRVSPDGKLVAFNATDSSGKTRIWLRPLSALVAQPLAGTDGTTRPFWSPDSRYLGFFAEGKLKKIDVTGGPPQNICDAPTGSDGSWSPEGVILFDGRGNDPINRVSAAGGVPVAEVKPDPAHKQSQVGWPEFLPDGRHFLFMVIGARAEDSAYRIGSLDSKESKAFAPAQTLITYAPPGYLLFVRDRTLVAQPFDAKAMKTTGEPVPLAEKIGVDNVGLARFSVSREGTLAYRTGESGTRLLWVDRNGKELDTAGEAGDSREPALSPKGDRLAFDLNDVRTGAGDIWVRDLARGVNSRSDVRRRRRVFRGLVSGRQPHRLQRGPRRPLGPLREGGGRNGGRKGAAQVEGPGVRDRLVPRRPLHHLLLAGQGHGPRHLGSSDLRRPQADPFPQDALQRGRCRVLTRRPLPRVLVERVRTHRDLRPELPRPGRQVAGLDRRRIGRALERRRQGDLLSRARPEGHGGGGQDGRGLRDRDPEGALPRTIPARHRAKPLRARGRRPEVSRRRAARPRRDGAHDGRPQLVRGTRKVG